MNALHKEGDYFTDGTHLYEIVGMDTDGYFYLLDSAELESTPLKVSAAELEREYTSVRT